MHGGELASPLLSRELHRVYIPVYQDQDTCLPTVDAAYCGPATVLNYITQGRLLITTNDRAFSATHAWYSEGRANRVLIHTLFVRACGTSSLCVPHYLTSTLQGCSMNLYENISHRSVSGGFVGLDGKGTGLGLAIIGYSLCKAASNFMLVQVLGRCMLYA